ncbi:MULTISPECIES: tetratricopeptide repeat protein [Bacteria]
MSGGRQALEQRRDQALRDLLELEQQVDRGELSPETETSLRSTYESEAARAIAEIERLSAHDSGETYDSEPGEDRESGEDLGEADELRASRGRQLLQPRILLYSLGLLSVVAAVLLLPGNLLDRPEGGFVTGNEALQNPLGTSGGDAPTAAELDNVTNEEMEAVVAANPDVIGMRLALADRYAAEGRYDLAFVHYRKALEREPGNPASMARLGWLMLQVGDPAEAARLVDQALAAEPELMEALWFKANILLYGFEDQEGAITVLDTLQKRTDLAAGVREQVEELRRIASGEVVGGTG